MIFISVSKVLPYKHQQCLQQSSGKIQFTRSTLSTQILNTSTTDSP